MIWERRIFITSGDSQTGEQIVQAFDAFTGQPIWTKRFPVSKYPKHAFNSYASCTPAVDEEQLYVLWRDGIRLSLRALTHDGDEAWNADAGICEEPHGYGSSPIVAGDVVCVENDNETLSEVLAFGRQSGDVRWRVPRPSGTTSFSTPCVLNPHADEMLLLLESNAAGLTAFDVATGRVAWTAAEGDLPQRCVGSPVVAGGLVFVSCGQGGKGLHMIAIRPPTDSEDAREIYRIKQGVPQVPTAVAAGDLLFLWQDNGTVTCIDIATGKQHWRQRVSGDCHGSPIRVGDRIFGVTREGEVVVVAASPEFKLLARNSLDEPSRATPAVANDRLYLRTESSLVCIGDAQFKER